MNFLTSEEGPLAGRKFNQVYSTFSPDAFGEVEGRIRELSARYIKEEKNGVYEGKLLNNWKIVGTDTDSKAHQDVAELINDDIIEIPSMEDGKVTNIKSINVDEVANDDDITKLSKKANIDKTKLKNVKTTGDLYSQINQLRKK